MFSCLSWSTRQSIEIWVWSATEPEFLDLLSYINIFLFKRFVLEFQSRVMNDVILSKLGLRESVWLVLLYYLAIHIQHALIIYLLVSMKKSFKVRLERGFVIPRRAYCSHVLTVGDMNLKNLKLSSFALFFHRKGFLKP